MYSQNKNHTTEISTNNKDILHQINDISIMQITLTFVGEEFIITGMQEFNLSIETDMDNNYHVEHNYWQHNGPKKTIKRIKLYVQGKLSEAYKSVYYLAYSLTNTYPLPCVISLRDLTCVKGELLCSNLQYTFNNKDSLMFSAQLVSHGKINILFTRESA